MRMALTGRHERMTAARARQLGILSEVVDPPERLRARAQELAETDRPQLAGGDGAPPSGRCGARSSSASPTPAGPGRSDLVGDVGPPRPGRGPAGLRRAERRELGMTDPTSGHDTAEIDTSGYSSYEALIVERRGRSGG